MDSRPEALPLEGPHPKHPARGAVRERVFDAACATLLLLLLSPLLLLVAVAILIEDGRPVLFFQERIGRNRQTFHLCKFRSMVAGADEFLHRRHVHEAVNGYAALRLPHDPRTTRVGRIIRRWSLDELPNLWNVIRGEMSLVGPRPLVPYEADTINPAYQRRFSLRPGVTGLAQVSGRLDMSHEERLALDINYTQNRSLLMDTRILLSTLPTVIRRRG